jgi:hypothetical protein
MRRTLLLVAAIIVCTFTACSTEPAENVTQTAATLVAEGKCEGAYTVHAWYEYRRVGAKAWASTPVSSHRCAGAGARQRGNRQRVEGLTPGTAYRYRLAYRVNDSQTVTRVDSQGTVNGTSYDAFRTLAATPPSSGKAVTRPVGSAPLSDGVAASRVARSGFEPRPDNADENRRIPTAAELSNWRAATTHECNWMRGHVTGNFTGTTDEIIQWVSHKWGLDEDIARAQAAKESWWHMSVVGDNDESFGLYQIRAPYHPGTYPLSALSTAFNADYYAMWIRYYYDGCAAWMNSQPDRTRDYAAGDIWGSVGAWFAGDWWPKWAQSYIKDVQGHLAKRTWAQPGFDSAEWALDPGSTLIGVLLGFSLGVAVVTLTARVRARWLKQRSRTN